MATFDGGVPLMNQTYGVTRAQAEKAFGDRLKVFLSPSGV